MKSSCLIASASRLSASIPASTQIALTCAPLKSSQHLESSSKLTSSLSTFIFREWISMIRARASSVGCGSSILRSNRPERSSAGSSTSGRFVAAITLMLSLLENPSSWLSSSSMVRCTSRSPLCSPPKRLVPIASSSSMKMIAPPIVGCVIVCAGGGGGKGLSRVWSRAERVSASKLRVREGESGDGASRRRGRLRRGTGWARRQARGPHLFRCL
mmetsp:Transcript_100288/g.286824  ORF Transcript_100288/g.286824 Transcript_100288/m.286824 type:complete len:215 (+) Transcript_100288:332-976(+)